MCYTCFIRCICITTIHRYAPFLYHVPQFTSNYLVEGFYSSLVIIWVSLLKILFRSLEEAPLLFTYKYYTFVKDYEYVEFVRNSQSYVLPPYIQQHLHFSLPGAIRPVNFLPYPGVFSRISQTSHLRNFVVFTATLSFQMHLHSSLQMFHYTASSYLPGKRAGQTRICKHVAAVTAKAEERPGVKQIGTAISLYMSFRPETDLIGDHCLELVFPVPRRFYYWKREFKQCEYVRAVRGCVYCYRETNLSWGLYRIK